MAYPDERWQARVAAGAASRERALFIAWQRERPAGCAGGYRDAPGGVPALISMWEAPSARRRGAARALVDAVAAWAQATGAVTLLLDVVSTQQAARALYERRGFRYTGRSEAGRRDPTQVLLEMELALTAS